MAGHIRYESSERTAEIVGVTERTIRRWYERGLVRSKTFRRGLVMFRTYNVSDARRVAAGK